jgi:hypothetical protein
MPSRRWCLDYHSSPPRSREAEKLKPLLLRFFVTSNRIWNMSRFKFFMSSFADMFVNFWSRTYIFMALSIFNWVAWIQPTNFTLTAITGINKGLGFNPLPTFDWNIVTYGVDPRRPVLRDCQYHLWSTSRCAHGLWAILDQYLQHRVPSDQLRHDVRP